jgi:hypothetical protein
MGPKIDWTLSMQNTIWDLLTQPGGYTYMGRTMEVFLNAERKCYRLEVTHSVGGYHGFYDTKKELLKSVHGLHVHLTEKHFKDIVKGVS